MKTSSAIQCRDFPCLDIRRESYVVPDVDVNPDKISIMMISEAAPQKLSDYYYAGWGSLFEQTTVQAFKDACAKVDSIKNILALGMYLTTAVKCGKTGYGIAAATIEQCSQLLEQEITQFPNVKPYMLMGDVAIKAFNLIAKRAGEKRVIPAGSTYKIRGQEYYFHEKRVFPSYLQRPAPVSSSKRASAG